LSEKKRAGMYLTLLKMLVPLSGLQAMERVRKPKPLQSLLQRACLNIQGKSDPTVVNGEGP